MLGTAELIAFVPTRDPQKSRRFYEQTLGLEFVSEDAFALVFKANGVTIRIANISNVDVKYFAPSPFTILGWHVSSVQATAQALREKGIELVRFRGMDQNSLGIWRSPGGAQVAWFKDPDGNILSITEI